MSLGPVENLQFMDEQSKMRSTPTAKHWSLLRRRILTMLLELQIKQWIDDSKENGDASSTVGCFPDLVRGNMTVSEVSSTSCRA